MFSFDADAMRTPFQRTKYRPPFSHYDPIRQYLSTQIKHPSKTRLPPYHLSFAKSSPYIHWTLLWGLAEKLECKICETDFSAISYTSGLQVNLSLLRKKTSIPSFERGDTKSAQHCGLSIRWSCVTKTYSFVRTHFSHGMPWNATWSLASNTCRWY